MKPQEILSFPPKKTNQLRLLNASQYVNSSQCFTEVAVDYYFNDETNQKFSVLKRNHSGTIHVDPFWETSL